MEVKQSLMVSLQKLWSDKETIQFFDPQTGWRARPVIIKGCEDFDRNELEEIVLWQFEEATKDFKAYKEPVPMTKDQQHDLSNILKDIKRSKLYLSENNHGRYWEGTNG